MTKTRLPMEEFSAGEHPVLVGEGALVALERLLLRDYANTPIFILGDENSLGCCLDDLQRHVPALTDARTMEVRSGELSKDLEVCRALWGHLAEAGADRSTLLVCLGGGVISDLGGFVAATYMRGIRCINVPTTLMGMVDAAIGGKVAIDMSRREEPGGPLRPARGHRTCIRRFLRTLGKRELLNGVAEMIKHGLIRDATHWNAVRRAPLHDMDALGASDPRSAAIKAEVVEEDPRENGPRKELNFGHTIGHAMEAFVLESDATQLAAWRGRGHRHGLRGLAQLAPGPSGPRKMDAHPGASARPVQALQLQGHRSPPRDRADAHDKKNREGGFRFTLLTDIGTCHDRRARERSAGRRRAGSLPHCSPAMSSRMTITEA